jgi:hypothetical protein
MKGLLGRIAQVGATLGATAINPALGVVVGSAFAGGEGGKRLGKKVAVLGNRAHKATGPLGAVALPAIIAPIAAELGIDMAGVCETVQTAVANFCTHPAGAIGLVSVLTVLLHGASRNSTRPRIRD